MNTAMQYTIALLALIGYFVVGSVSVLMMISIQEWAEKHAISHRYGVLALYRRINLNFDFGYDASHPFGIADLLFPILVPLGLLELGLRLLLRHLRPTTPNAPAA